MTVSTVYKPATTIIVTARAGTQKLTEIYRILFMDPMFMITPYVLSNILGVNNKEFISDFNQIRGLTERGANKQSLKSNYFAELEWNGRLSLTESCRAFHPPLNRGRKSEKDSYCMLFLQVCILLSTMRYEIKKL